ncbi:hypothetical protein PcaKH35_05040 [Parageobacillus caldoxylosilyticus]|nr:hypothetical protein PcaKH35_05040 [Parageobacillus caldoxylosilyticus]
MEHTPGDYDEVVKGKQYRVYCGILAAAHKMKELGIIIDTRTKHISFIFLGWSKMQFPFNTCIVL